MKLTTARKSSGRSALAVTQLTEEMVVQSALSNAKDADYIFKCLVKYPPHAKPGKRKARRTMGERLAELTISKLARDLFPHIDWDYLATYIVREEATRRYIAKRYPAPQVRMRAK